MHNFDKYLIYIYSIFIFNDDNLKINLKSSSTYKIRCKKNRAIYHKIRQPTRVK